MSKSQDKKKSNKKDVDLQEEYRRQGKIAAIESQKARMKQQVDELSDILDPELNPDAAEQAETSGEWVELRKYIVIHFPEAKQHASLSANQIMVAVAHCMGWDVAKIVKHSGIKSRTIYSWLDKPEISHLVNEFGIKEGQKDPSAMMSSMGFKALKVIDTILSTPVDPRNKDFTKLQQDTAKFQVQQSYGKAEETLNVNDATYKDIAEMVHKKKMAAEETIEEVDEEELFH